MIWGRLVEEKMDELWFSHIESEIPVRRYEGLEFGESPGLDMWTWELSACR